MARMPKWEEVKIVKMAISGGREGPCEFTHGLLWTGGRILEKECAIHGVSREVINSLVNPV